MRLSTRLRGVSLGVQALVILGIAIAVALIAGGIIMSQTRTLASKGATLSVIVDAHDAGDGYTAVTVTVKNNGPEAVTINSLSLYVNGNSVTCTWDPAPPVTVKAGSSASFTTICYTGASIGDKVTVEVSGVTSLTGTQVSVSGNAEILP